MNAPREATEKRAQANDVPLTITQFCERYGTSKHTYYRMRAKGRMPRETQVSPRRCVILAASLREWERRRLEASGKQQYDLH
ncbi:helix-turn-helix domain-containing protein [Paraburkholderia sediminicola]|uniref:helix-turn-helix transcriptional regulator n=1 Tax=Paraburkholderia sediminicola TaxID=458836 RepID=UPI0038BCF832